MAAVTWNPSDKNANITLSGGNLVASESGSNPNVAVRATLARSTGKYYFEATLTGRDSTLGIIVAGSSLAIRVGNTIDDWAFANAFTNLIKRHNAGGTTIGTYTYTGSHNVGIAVDLSAGKMWFRFDGTWQEGDPATATTPSYTGVSGTFYPAWSSSNSVEAASATLRPSDASFVYAVPSGFLAWEDPPITIVATQSPNTAAISATVTTGVSINATQSPNTAAIAAASLTVATIAASQSSNTAAISASATTGAAISATQSSNRTSIKVAGTVVPISVTPVKRSGLMLWEPLPLRTSAMLGNFAESFVLAHRFGDLTSGRFKLRRLDDTTYFVADHPMPVTQVFIDLQESKGWERRLQSDGDGHTWTVIKFAAPIPIEADVSACGTGKSNPRTGALLENPAEIAEDILRLAGRSDPWWDQLRAESAAAGLRLAGSIDSVLSIRAWLDAVLGSAGAIWCPGMARLYPVSEVSGYVAKLDKHKISNLTVSANLDNTADIFRLSYDPDAASATSQHYVEMTANPALYGGVVREETLPYLRTPGNAESVTRRLLQWLAGERYDITFDCGDLSVRAGQWVQLIAHPLWKAAMKRTPFADVDPYVMVLGADPTPGSRTVHCEGKALVSVPLVTVTAHSVALPTTRDAGVEVAVKNGVATLTVSDENDKPVFNARVSLDGGPAKKTDEQGLVSFVVKSGQHQLAIQAPGKLAQILTVQL
jgi:hypothetical protein